MSCFVGHPVIILWLLKSGVTMLIYNKHDIEFVTEFPCLLGHPVYDFEFFAKFCPPDFALLQLCVSKESIE